MHTPRRPAPTRRQLSRLLAALVLVGGAGGTFVACSDVPLGPAPTRGMSEVGASDSDQLATRAGASAPDANPLAWIGREHNRAMDALLPGLRARVLNGDVTATTRCQVVQDETSRYALAGNIVTDGTSAVSFTPAIVGSVSAKLGTLACHSDEAARLSLRAFIAQLVMTTHAHQPSPDALQLIDQLDHLALTHTSAANFDQNARPIESAALTLPDSVDRDLVLSSAAVGRASAHHVEQHGPGGPAPEPPPLLMGGDPRGLDIGKAGRIVKSDIRGCVSGFLSGLMTGGRHGALAGCVVNGITNSIEAALE